MTFGASPMMMFIEIAKACKGTSALLHGPYVQGVARRTAIASVEKTPGRVQL